MLKAYKYRLYPNKYQKSLLSRYFGCVRFIFNQGLEKKVKSYEETGKSPNYNELATGMLKDLKKEKEWLREIYSQSLQASLKNLETAFKNFFQYHRGYPKFKNKYSDQSCSFPQFVQVDFEDGFTIFPKIGKIKTTFHRQFEGQIKTCTISKTTTDKYHVSILVDDGKELPEKPEVIAENAVGFDLGIKHYLIEDNGNKTENPKYLRNEMKRLKCLQRRASKKKKGSKNRQKSNKKVAKKHEKIRNQRNDFQHKLSTKIVSENQTLCFETLNVDGMIKNHCLALSIADASWGSFVRKVEYKCEWQGKNFIQIGTFSPSSKRCSSCGYIYKELTLDMREWTCPECGTVHDRDVNGAKSVKLGALEKYQKDKIVLSENLENVIGKKKKSKKYSGSERPGELVEMLSVERSMKQEAPSFSDLLTQIT